MRYILIDTSTWINLLFDINGTNYVQHLIELTNSKKISLLVTEQIISEWSNQQDKGIRLRINAEKSNMRKTLSVSNHLFDTNSFIDTYSERNENLIKKITSLITEQSTKVQYTDAIGSEVMKRYMARIAPFHKNGTSHNDALIFFSTTNYIKANAIESISFITANTNDFSDPNRLSALHPDLMVEGIEIEYNTSLDQFFKNNFPLKQIAGDINDHSNISICYDESIKNLHLLEQLHLSLKYYFNQIDYIPGNILCLLYPFKIAGDGYSSYEGNKITTNNKAVIEVLLQRNGNIVDIKDADEKIIQIRNWLNQNSISTIEDYHNRNTSFTFSSYQQCDCVICLYQRLDYISLIKNMPIHPTKDFRENLAYAFIHFELGNYYTSFQFLQRTYEISTSKKLDLVRYICAINIKRLSKHVYNSDTSKTREITTYSNRIHLDTIYNSLYTKDIFSKFFVQKYHENNFYYQYFEEIETIVNKMRDDYRVYNNGYNRNNSYAKKLINTFIEYRNLQWKTPLLYSHYANNNTIFEKVLEGYILSYKTGDNGNGKLLGFNNEILEQIMHFSTPDSLLKILNRYDVRSIKYIHKNHSQYIFFDKIIELLKNYKAVNAQINNDGTKIWNNKLFDQIFTSIILCSVLECNNDILNKFFAQLIIFLNENNKGRAFLYRHVKILLYLKGDLLNKSLLIEFAKSIIKNEYLLNDSDVIIAFCQIVNEHHTELLYEENSLNMLLIEKYLLNDNKENTFTIDVMPHLYSIIDPKSKNTVHTHINNLLEHKFDSEIYVTYSLYDIIDYKKYFSHFLTTISKQLDNNYFGDREKNRRLEDLINIIFKNKIQLKKEEIEQFKGILDYYDWLLDMDNFNYAHFNPLWILRNQVVFYLEQIYGHPKVHTAIKSYFRDTRSPNKLLLKYYFKYRQQ